MRSLLLALAIGGLLLPQPAAAEKAKTLPKADAAFIAEYKKLQKKYPKESQSFMLTYQPSYRDSPRENCEKDPFCAYDDYTGYCHCAHPE